MNRMIRAAASAAILASGFSSLGCLNTTDKPTVGDRGRNALDPCYPERYSHAARQATLAPFAQQVYNGHVLNQTIFNYFFEPGTDKLTAAGLDKLDSIARTRPAPDPRLYIQSARDIPTGEPEKVASVRNGLDVKRAVAIQKYLSTQPAIVPVAYEIFVHDPAVPGINSEFIAGSYRGSGRGYVGGVRGGGGIAVQGTGSGGGGVTGAAGGGSTAPPSGGGTPGGDAPPGGSPMQ